MPIHLAITRRVKPGCEAEFLKGLREFTRESMRDSGVLGVHILMPPQDATTRDYGILRTFAGEAEREAFYASPEFKAWCERANTYCEDEPEYRRLCGLEAWFRASNAPPPRWKMATATILGVFPTSLMLSYFGGALLAELPLVLHVLVFAVSMVGILTWLVMPVVTRLLHPWLYPSYSLMQRRS
jgi:antibiotic biosynthesis monooxygenase (ABM) superfamily enzyme